MSTKISKGARLHLLRVVEKLEFPVRVFDGWCNRITIGGIEVPSMRASYSFGPSPMGPTKGGHRMKPIAFQFSSEGGPVRDFAKAIEEASRR